MNFMILLLVDRLIPVYGFDFRAGEFLYVPAVFGFTMNSFWSLPNEDCCHEQCATYSSPVRPAGRQVSAVWSFLKDFEELKLELIFYPLIPAARVAVLYLYCLKEMTLWAPRMPEAGLYGWLSSFVLAWMKIFVLWFIVEAPPALG